MGKLARDCAAVATSVLVSGILTSAAYAQQAAEPAPAPVELPPLTVEASQKKKAAAKKPVKAQSAPQNAVAQPAPVQEEPTGPGNANASDKTPYGPVKNYLPKNTETGIKTDTPLKEIPQSISVVGAEQIRDMGAQTLQEALQYVPGVVADGYGLDSRTDSAFIRGTEAAEFIDGLRRTSSYYSYNYRIDPYFMERIEVLRGPASVLYGQAPVGGIINSVSKRPQKRAGRRSHRRIRHVRLQAGQVRHDRPGHFGWQMVLSPDGPRARCRYTGRFRR